VQFDLDENRALLKTATRELLEREAPLAITRTWMDDGKEGFSSAFYRQLAELGYLGLTIPESHGGAAAGAQGLAAALHEMGRVAMPGPYLDLVLAADLLHRVGGSAAQPLLAQLVAGQRMVVLARQERASGIEPAVPATRLERGHIRGRKLFVPFGAYMDALVVTTAEGLGLAVRPDAGWSIRPLDTLDHAQRFAEIELDQPGTLLADLPSSRPILEAVDRLGALAASALLLGLAERALELTVGYLNERKAFGVPIGSFQVLQHRAADMVLRVESSRSAVYRAAWALDEAPESADLLVAAAKAYCGDSARLVCGDAIQLFGGVGYTWEYDPHIYFKRAKTLEQFYGATRVQLERALRAVGV
jgi:alkylation response protein AidB-like acyl-CoA dehydrogenase